MKRFLMRLTVLFLAGSTFYLLVGCQFFQDDPIREVAHVYIDESTIEEMYQLENFDLSLIFLTIVYNDNTEETIALDEAMLSGIDLAKLLVAGTHTVTIHYQGKTVNVTVTLAETLSEMEQTLRALYVLGVGEGLIDESYEDWLESVRGEDGRSAYEIYLIYYPLYLGTEEDWLNDLLSGRLIVRTLHTVCFESEGGSVLPCVNDVALYDTIELPIPIKEGYTFLGWFLGNTANDEQLTNTSPIQDDMILYARWQLKTYTVTFLNYDDVVISKQEVAHGYSAVYVAAPSRVGHNYIGWDQSFNVITEDTVIRAVYNPHLFKVSLISDDPYMYVDPIWDVPYGSAAPFPEPPEHPIYDFIAWSFPPFYDPIPFDINTPITEDITLYAHWQLKVFYVHFDSVGGTEFESLETTHGNLVGPLPIPVKIDHIFEGWFDSVNAVMMDEYIFYDYTEDLNLVAVWTNLFADFTMMVVEEEAIVVEYFGIEPHLVLEDTYLGYPIVAIAEGAFFGNNTLVSLTLGQYVRFVDDAAFSQMTSLETLILPNTLTQIGDSILVGTNLKHLTLSSEAPFALFDYFGSTFISLETVEYAIGASFINKTLTQHPMYGATLILAEDRHTIDNEQFKDCPHLVDLIIPESVTHIGISAFENATGLIRLILPDSIEYVADYAFRGASNLLEIDFKHYGGLLMTPVTSEIGVGVFDATHPDLRIYMYTSVYNNTKLLNNWNTVFTVKDVYGIQFYLMGEETWVGGIIKDEDILFIPEMIWGYPVTQIVSGAFTNTSIYTEIVIPHTVTVIGDSAFSNLQAEKVTFAENSTLNSIGWYAFSGARITTFTLPETVSDIGRYAFSSMPNLTAFIFADGFAMTALPQGVFQGTSSLSTIVIPATITHIGDYAFQQSNLINLTFAPGSMLTHIGQSAFKQNVNLESVTLPLHINYIDDHAFYGCSNLREVIIERPSSAGNINLRFDVFFATHSTFTIYVPDDSVDDYKTMSWMWGDIASKIKGISERP